MNKKSDAFDTLVENTKGTKDKLFLRAVQLFSDKGYDKVGIRELCAAVGIKEASFYNHYEGKEALLDEIFSYWEGVNAKTILDEDELVKVSLQGGPTAMLEWMMKSFARNTDSPVVHAILSIVRMEGFTDPRARSIALKSLYYYRRDFTLKALRALREAGRIADVDLDDWTASYYYGLIGILDEYVLRELAEEDIGPMIARVERHMGLFARMLEPGKGRS